MKLAISSWLKGAPISLATYRIHYISSVGGGGVRPTNLFEAVKAGTLGVDVVLIDLVSKDEELLLGGKADDALHVVPRQHLDDEYDRLVVVL